MQSVRYAFTIILTLLFTQADLAAQTTDCGGMRTQTQGGWGTSAAGNNPGAYRDAHFDSTFPNGILIGCDSTVLFTSSQAVETYLPAGGTASPLNQSSVDPSNGESVLLGQTLALSLSVGFDLNDPDFGASEVALQDMIISSGDYEGYSVAEVLQIAYEVLGHCDMSTSPSIINEVISSINENYVDGTTDNGFLICPEEEIEEIECHLALLASELNCQLSDSLYILTLTLEGANGAFTLLSEHAIAGSGQSFCLSAPIDSSSFQHEVLTLAFPLGVNYDFEIIQVTDEGCAPSSINSCHIALTEGPAPDCCTLEISCSPEIYPTFTCLSEVPPADSSVVEVLQACGPVTYELNESSTGGGCFNDPMILTRTYTLSSGEFTSTCSQSYRIVDSIPPSITCPPTQFIDCSTGDTAPTAFATAEDNCSAEVSISYFNLPSSSCDGFTRQWSALDACGNMNICYQEVVITDNTPPTLAVPQDITVECTANITPSFTGQATAYDACSEVTIDYTDSIDSAEACQQSITRTWTATDGCGNSTVAQQIITRMDMTGPTIYNVPPSTTIQCGDAPAPVEAIAVDACSGDTLEVSMEENISENGCRTTIQRIFSASDSCGNATTLVRNIIIEDTQAPSMTCPADVYLNCGDSDLSPDDLGYPEAMDNCSGSFVTISYQDSELNSNACPPVILRQWMAVDTCGNSANCIQRIHFQDNTPPGIDCVPDAVVNCAAGESTDPEFTGIPIGSDECSEVTISYNDGPINGDCPVTFTRTWIVQDACFNAAFCQQTITIIDEEAPQIECSDVSISCAYSTADPNVSGYPSVADCNPFDLSYVDGPLQGACPQTFVRTWTATDICGNMSICTQTISLVDNMIPVVFCPNDTIVSCEADLSPESLGLATAIDFCSDVSVSHVDAYELQSCGELLQRTWIATDACGNSRICTQSITIIPDGSIEIACPEEVTVACDGETSPSVTGQATASAACSEVEIWYTDSLIMGETTSTSSADCGQLRTQTQGGWGTNASGNNPGSYRDAHFEAAFPEGITIGCAETLHFSSSAAVQDFLPSGSTARPLEASLIDPTGYHNVLAGQVLALSLSVGFDAYDPDFGQADIALAEMEISSGEYSGWTVAEIMDLANEVLGACNQSVAASTINNVISSINENYVDGNSDQGFLDCPDGETTAEDCGMIIRTWYANTPCGDVSSCEQIIYLEQVDQPQSFSTSDGLHVYPSPTTGPLNISIPEGALAGDLISVLDLRGVVMEQRSYSGVESQLYLDINEYEKGSYIIRWTSTQGTKTSQVVRL